jgi:hypothetical protein
MFVYTLDMGILDDPLNPHAVENLRRSIAMLPPGQEAHIDRDRALNLLEELKRLQAQHIAVASELRGILDHLEGALGPAGRSSRPRPQRLSPFWVGVWHERWQGDTWRG